MSTLEIMCRKGLAYPSAIRYTDATLQSLSVNTHHTKKYFQLRKLQVFDTLILLYSIFVF